MNQTPILQMAQIQEITFKRAIALLESMKCVYAIIDPIGKKHGTLEVKETTFKSERKFPHGERSSYIRKYMKDMMVGNVIEIPFDKYGGADIQTSVGSTSNRMWGRGSVTSTINRIGSVVEVMRIY